MNICFPGRMLRILLLFSGACAAAGAAHAASSPGHRLRQVDLSRDKGTIHALQVVGAPHLTTTLRLPDSFSASNVACGGDCVDAHALEQGKGGNAGANWVLDLRPQEHTLHLWPATLPTADNPASAFESNIYVGLDGGDVLNIALRLVDASRPDLAADAVVDVVLSHDLGFSSRLQQEKSRLQQGAEARAQEALHARLRGQLTGRTKCQEVRWSVPHRHEKMLVRIKQTCSTGGDESLRWVHFSVENRAAVPLALGGIRLTPDMDELEFAGHWHERGASTQQTVLAAGARTEGVALVELEGRALRRSGWTLWVEAQEPRREQVRIGAIRF